MKHKKILIFSFLFVSAFLLAAPLKTDAVLMVTQVDAVIILEPGVELSLPGIEMEFQYDSLNGFSARIPYRLYRLLQSSTLVSAIQIDRSVSILEDTLDWGVDDINAERVWGGAENAVNVIAGNTAGQGVKVAILDTGIDYTHPDLDANYKGGYDFVNNDAYPLDDHGHGSHCAGIVAAEDNGVGVIGVAPLASLYGVKVLSSSGSGSISQIVAGINWAINNGMDVISMSLGATTGDTTLEAACTNARNAGIVVVCASGNNYGSSISYPARYSSTIAVGATDSSHKIASFSNIGPQQDVVAPGVNIYSTYRNGGYTTMSGTSMACPMVSGAVALILSANPSLTPEEVRTILHDTAIDLGTAGFDNTYGYGLIDCVAAVDAAGGGGSDDTQAPVVDISAPLNGATVSGSVTITASATDNVGVSYVQCRIDSGTWNSDSSSPYQWTWDTTSYSDGTHTITCAAYDAAGNSDQDSITVIVDNTGPVDNELTSGVTVYSSLSGTGQTEMWYINVGPNALSMRSVLNCGTADFDLYGRLNVEPTTSSYAWRGYTSGGEDVTYNNPGEGTWYIMVRSYSGSGAYDLTVTLTYATPDTTAPQISITSPNLGDTLNGQVTITASATDNVGVTRVEFYADGSLIGTDTSSPYTCTLDTTTLNDGSHTLSAKAYDAAGNSNVHSITISVDNSGGTPTNIIYVSSIVMTSKPVYFWIWIIGYDVTITVSVADINGNPVSGVAVSLLLTLPSGSTVIRSSTTSTAGTVSIVYSRGSRGTYTATVTDLSKTDYIYDPSQNIETSETLVV
ncbi:MAG: S8 family serine peptidase [Candidatus Heimdallarchaeota archaeon]|nr:S8 family serine peptidase [Candidatus Heimdallarchaeota archaeon]